ncbi:MAG: branched-chain amino acid ABC transporter permease [Aquamicrobium sp.]|nr:branched-chain amino acid ABC transporter permease [Aquamicrobium sp.]
MSRTDVMAPSAAGRVGAAPGITTFATEAMRIAAIIAALLALAWYFSRDPFILNILAYTFLFAALSSAWNIIGGFGGQFSLGHGVFFAIGAYVTANLYIHFGVSPWLALVPAAALAAGVAMLVSWPTFRLKGPFFAIATMALNEVAFVLANYFSSLTGGPRGLTLPFKAGLANMIFTSRFHYALLMIGFLAVCMLVAAWVYRSRLGYYLQAVHLDEDAARAVGIRVLYVKLTGMAISAALTGIGGAIFAMYLRFVDPPTLLTLPDIGVKFALIALIGGVGTLYGPLAGALLVIPLEMHLRASLGASVPGANLIVLGAILVLCALFMKRGIVGTALMALDRVRRGRK